MIESNRRNSCQYQRILDVLEDYWLTEPDELKVRVRMDFVKANGETQRKCITWINPQYEYTGPKRKMFVSAAELDDEYFKRKERDFWDHKNYKLKEEDDMKRIDMTSVQESKDYKRLPAGAYICRITGVQDVPEKEYLKISYDIDQGDRAGYFSAIRRNHPDWSWIGAYCKSYKPTALPTFKRFCTAVSKSNLYYTFDGCSINADETTLKDKLIGLVLREEEYISSTGEVRTRLIVHKEFPVKQLDEQIVPDVKRLKQDQPLLTDDADELPF